MLWTIIVILVVLWLLGFIGHFGGGLIHLLLVIAVVVLVINLIQGRLGSERICFRPASISSDPHNRFCTPKTTPLYAALGLHTANSVLGGMDHEGTTSSKLKT